MAPFQPVIHKYTTPRYLTVNVFLVETEHGVVVIDGATAVSTSREIRGIVDNQISKPILAVLLTHGHPDHYVGVGEIIQGLDVPVFATQGVIDFAKYQDKEKFEGLLRRNYGDDLPTTRVFPNRVVQNDETVRLDGVAFQVQDFGPCESDADSSWTVETGGVKHIFLGDLIYNHTHCYLRDGHAPNWLTALNTLLNQNDHRTVFHPAHGDECGIEMIYWQEAYIHAFLATLQSMLGQGDTLTETDKAVLVAHMQSFLPNDKLINLMKYEMDETTRLLRRRGVV